MKNRIGIRIERNNKNGKLQIQIWEREKNGTFCAKATKRSTFERIILKKALSLKEARELGILLVKNAY